MSEPYVLVDALSEGLLLRETFMAADDAAARRQARAAAEGTHVQLWKGDQLLAYWTRRGAALISRRLDAAQPRPAALPSAMLTNVAVQARSQRRVS